MIKRIALLLLLSAGPSWASSAGADFLKLGDGARPLALGEAFTSVPGTVDSLYHNAGAMAWMENPEISFTHSEWLSDTNLDLLSYGHPTAGGVFGVSALRLGSGDLEGRDANRQKTGDFSAEDIAALLSYSHKIGSYVGAGANIKYLRSRIDNESASSIALDAGASAHVPNLPLWVGGSVLNIGSGLRFEDQVDRLPLTIALGVSGQVIKPLLLSMDFTHEPYDSRSELHMGGEYSLSMFDFRIGYVQTLQGQGDTALSAPEHIRGGLGVHWQRYRADYTLAPFGDLGLTQRFSLSVFFGDVSDGKGPENMQPHASAKTDPEQISALFF